ncbi:MAG: TIGR04076 family protein [Pseudobutyrivibrio sp.]|mgnify:CR=1 FL=1|nr:TIGR04076 family protein [Pseudobutyrivibrio sp.]
MYENHNVKVTVLSSKCPKYKAGDEIHFNGAFIDKESSAELCMVAMQAIYPFIYAFRRGGKLKEGPYQCTDCEETVVFRIEQND